MRRRKCIVGEGVSREFTARGEKSLWKERRELGKRTILTIMTKCLSRQEVDLIYRVPSRV